MWAYKVTTGHEIPKLLESDFDEKNILFFDF
jgi:hypothetical protein